MYLGYINKVLKYLTEEGYDVLYIGAFGSFNYGLETDNSDYDMKAIVNIDTTKLLRKDLTYKTVNFTFGQCEIINIIDFGKELSEFYIPYLEILFSKINYINEKFDYEELKEKVNNALVNNRKYLALTFLETMERINVSFMASSILDFNGKKTYNIIRLYNLFRAFNKTKKYGECLMVENDKEKMFCHKLGKISRFEADRDCKEFISKMKVFTNMNYVESPYERMRIYDYVVDMFNMTLKKKIIEKERMKVMLKIVKCGGGIDIEERIPTVEKNENERGKTLKKCLYFIGGAIFSAAIYFICEHL